MNQEKVNDFASFVETLHDVDLDKDNIREFFTAIPFATCKLMNKFAAEKKDVIHNIGSKETPSPLGKGRNCPRFLLLLIIFISYFLISENICIFGV